MVQVALAALFLCVSTVSLHAKADKSVVTCPTRDCLAQPAQ